SITSIGDWAFNGCTSLTSITIPDSVTSIGIGALEGCESLASITIPDEVTSIDVRAFFGCKSLTSIAIPDGVTSIGGGTFMWCSSLTSVTIPDSVTSIAESAFFGCRSLTSITIPDSVTSIGDDAFGYCRSLTSVTIPDSVTSIGNYAFYNCTNLVIYGFAGSYAQSYAKTNDIAFELIQVPVTGVSLDKKTLSLYTGESATLTAMIAPSNATNINVFWSSTNETAVTVSEGTLTANAAGTAIITARTEDGNKVATCVVTVTDRIVVATLTLDKSVLDIKSGNSEKLNVIFNPEYTTDKTVTWLSLDESIATVDENGVVKGIGEGSTTIIVMSNSGNKSASCTVNVTEPITYSFGQSVQIGLIEPWFLKANARVYTVENPINIDYSTLVDYGAYFIRKSELSDKNATQDTLAVEDIINDSDTVKYSKSAGTATVDGSYITASYDKGLYTYEMSDSIFVLFYIEDESGMSYAPIRERNMKELLEKRKNDTENFENVLERNVYTAMDKLELNIGVYRAQFDEIDELPVMSAPRLSDYVAENGAFEEETAKSYSFGNSVQIILVEPWGLKFNARVYNGANPTNINYGSIEEYGAIVYYDTEGNAESMTAEELRTKSDAYVFSSKNGDATIDGSYITALYNKGIYTYQLDSNAYVMFYVKDENGYHYGDVKVRNAYELAKVRAQDTTGNFGEQEKQVYLDMVEMYEAVKAYRDDYFANN
ncbi:MAG: leucine-rich repeat protein, partial [Oscillospiraceae bacterium]|nr:leucine-rich repeat protein [Oscillospiraceae bacterium]